ncbi:MAG TPA: serine/threonine-protein kinase, partial [Pyrinomonadaceae bacterium]|nr:serine/threonine-protein kinase [Pyrinomonadaceae bacterium]
MSPEHWQQVEEIFQTALDLEPEERAPYLTLACGNDAELRREVEKLLSQYEQAGDFIDGPLYEQSGISALAALMNRAGDPVQGRRVGAYRIEREIGRGGMGTVYEAVRADNEFRRRVAVKLVKRGMDTDFILRRFRRERRILATLEHPNIACLLDGGTTDDGLPYFVMEYIEGQSLYRYSDARRLSIAERLKLFRPICEAVHYAHEKHVVHRDLKPSNVLVTGEGAPKLLDFGIAKLLKPDSAYDTIDPTQTALRMMTPEYASPEQVRGESASPASDIYSLGVMLYELLTGHRPYHLKNRAMHEIARVICEEDPENLSVSLTRDDGLVPTGAREKTTLEFLFQARNSNLESLRRELSGDLNGIVFKALRKDAKDRYVTAIELRDDITRHLEGRPVAAPRYAPPQAKTTRAAKDDKKSGEVSIAVLPFKMIGPRGSDETGDEYLGVGLADALITRLSNVRRLVLRPTSSVLGYGASDSNLFDAGRALGVEYILNGNIRRVGERIRVTAQLLNVKDNSTRWSESFDERFTDVLELEDSLSEKVARSLIPRLTGEERRRLEKRGTNNPEAYEFYLRGRYFYNKFSGESLLKAVESYREAIRLDAQYAQPHVGIADFYTWSAIFGEMPSREAFPLAAAAARRALEIDPA